MGCLRVGMCLDFRQIHGRTKFFSANETITVGIFQAKESKEWVQSVFEFNGLEAERLKLLNQIVH